MPDKLDLPGETSLLYFLPFPSASLQISNPPSPLTALTATGVETSLSFVTAVKSRFMGSRALSFRSIKTSSPRLVIGGRWALIENYSTRLGGEWQLCCFSLSLVTILGNSGTGFVFTESCVSQTCRLLLSSGARATNKLSFVYNRLRDTGIFALS